MLRYGLKGLTSLTSRPNIALNAVKFYSTLNLFNKSTISARNITLER